MLVGVEQVARAYPQPAAHGHRLIGGLDTPRSHSSCSVTFSVDLRA